MYYIWQIWFCDKISLKFPLELERIKIDKGSHIMVNKRLIYKGRIPKQLEPNQLHQLLFLTNGCWIYNRPRVSRHCFKVIVRYSYYSYFSTYCHSFSFNWDIIFLGLYILHIFMFLPQTLSLHRVWFWALFIYNFSAPLDFRLAYNGLAWRFHQIQGLPVRFEEQRNHQYWWRHNYW